MSCALQPRMTAYIRPSILAHVTDEAGNIDRNLLGNLYADTRYDEDDEDAWADAWERAQSAAVDILVGAIAEAAEAEASVTNDFGEFYIDGWTSIPWCDEDTMLAYFG